MERSLVLMLALRSGFFGVIPLRMSPRLAYSAALGRLLWTCDGENRLTSWDMGSLDFGGGGREGLLVGVDVLERWGAATTSG